MNIRSPLLQNLATLLLLAIALPFNAIAVLLTWIMHQIRSRLRSQSVPRGDAKNILIAGARMTKTLQLARSFHAAGHRVILIDTEKFWLSGNQFSNAVAGFYTVPDPNQNLVGYVEKLQAIAHQEQIDLFIPVAMFAVTYFEGWEKHPLEGFCQVCHFDRDTVQMLDDKFAFAEQARSLSLPIPKSFKITNPKQVLDFDFSQEQRPYILKSILYDARRRLDLTKLPCATEEQTAAFVNSLPISEKTPWMLQEFIPGQEYCTHSTVDQGRSTMYCCCASSAFQVNYGTAHKPEIQAWVDRFLTSINGYGQASFDFIEAADGTVYAIECNPRTHSAMTLFYNHPGVSDAYLHPDRIPTTLQPLPDAKPTYWLYHELWRLTEVRSLSQLKQRLQKITREKEAIFSVDDPLPFFMVYHWQIPLLLLDALWQQKGWIRIDFNIGELIH
jgi:predicted ATP-grasp superfamily ATP-dependent carboligase